MLLEQIDNKLFPVLLIILLVIAVNLGLWAAWKRKDIHNQSDWLRKLGEGLRNPWQIESDLLQELTKQVEELRRSRSDTQQEEDHIDQ